MKYFSLSLLIVFLTCATAFGEQIDRQVLAIGDPGAYVDAFSDFGIQVKTVSFVDAEKCDFSDYLAVFVCAENYKKPAVLQPSLQNKLEKYVASGGSALIEFALPAPGRKLFGISPNRTPVLARHERIAVTRVLSEKSGCPVGTLLDEQYSYVLPVKDVPHPAVRFLDYGKFIGTYKAKNPLARSFELWIDLGKPTRIKSASLDYKGEPGLFCPNDVTLAAGTEEKDISKISRFRGSGNSHQKASFKFAPKVARYVVFRCSNLSGKPAQALVHFGRVTITDVKGKNLVSDSEFRIVTPVKSTLWRDWLPSAFNIPPSGDNEATAKGALDNDLGLKIWPALLKAHHGKGNVFLLFTKIGDYSKRHYRPSEKWRGLVRELCLNILPLDLQRHAFSQYVPLKAYTNPRRWVPTGSTADLVIETSPDAQVFVKCGSIETSQPVQDSPGRWHVVLTPAEGEHTISVSSETELGGAKTQVKLLVESREETYRRAVEQNIQWFLRSGILPEDDGSAGVYSTIFVPSPDDGPQEDLAGPIRTDCEAMVIDAFIMFSEITGDSRWMERARNIADHMLQYQHLDLAKADYGSFSWIIRADGKAGDEGIYFHDNESRDATALLNLYAHTGEIKYLEAGLRSMQLMLDISREDCTIANHSTSPDFLNSVGRSSYRELSNYTMRPFDMLRWYRTYAVTGDITYLNAAKTIARLYGDCQGYRQSIGPYACRLFGDPNLPSLIEQHFSETLTKPDVTKYGMLLLSGPGDYTWLYLNDCSIVTDTEHLSDQLYTAPIALKEAWFAYKATGSESALKVFTTLADYLVRIQLEDPSPKVNGCWVRGFDPEAWEDFGAPYDPNYGPYHAYSGWTNSVISEALAFYLEDVDPFALQKDLWPAAKDSVEKSRSLKPHDKIDPENIALGKPYTVSPAPEGNAESILTNGIIDGKITDGESVTWAMPKIGKTFTAHVTIDLGKPVNAAMVGIRMGALNHAYNADKVIVEVGENSNSMKIVAALPAGVSSDWSVWKALEPIRGRFVRITYIKTRKTGEEDRLAIGEIIVQQKAD